MSFIFHDDEYFNEEENDDEGHEKERSSSSSSPPVEDAPLPFEFDTERNVLRIRRADGSFEEVIMSPDACSSLIRNAAKIIKKHDVVPLMKEQEQGHRKVTTADVALYDADKDELMSSLAAEFCSEIMTADKSTKYKNEKVATVVHGMFKLAQPRIQSPLQLHLTQNLRLDRASKRNIETLSKFGVGASTKALGRLLEVNYTQNDDFTEEVLAAAKLYGLKIICVIHDNLQWALLGKFVHSITGAVIVLDLAELIKCYREERERGKFMRIIAHDSCASTETITNVDAVMTDTTTEATEAMEDDVESSGAHSQNSEDSYDLESLRKDFPDPEGFVGMMPMLDDEDSNVMFQLLVDQVFCRMCLLVPLLMEVPTTSLFGEIAKVSTTTIKTPALKGSRKQNDTKASVDMNMTADRDDAALFTDDKHITKTAQEPNKDQSSSKKVLSTSNQTVFDQMHGDLYMLKPKPINFSSNLGSMAFPNDIIKLFGIGRGNEPKDVDFKDNMELLIVTGDGAPVKTHLNILLTPNEKLHSRLLHCKANLHVIFSSLGAFHVECKFLKNHLSFYGHFMRECLTMMDRTTDGQQNYTINVGRFDDTFTHVWVIQDAIGTSAIRSFIKWCQHEHSEPTALNFGIFLSKSNKKGRTALMFMIHLEPFYLMNYAVRSNQFDLYVAALLLTLLFDHAIGDIEYGTLKAYFILRLVMLSEYWREIFAHFFFTTNLNEKGVCLDLLCEYIHFNVKSRMRHVGNKTSFFNRLEKLELKLPETVRLATAHHNPSNFSGGYIKPLNMKVILQMKDVDIGKVLQLADIFETNGMWTVQGENMSSFDSRETEPVFSNISGTEVMGGCLGTMFQTGKAVGNVMYKDFSDAVVRGSLECKELWTEKLNGNLPAEEEDDIDEEDEDEEDVGNEETPGAEGNEDAGEKRKVKPLKTSPSWKPVNCSHMTVGNMKGHEKKVTKMDEDVLELLAVPRTQVFDISANDGNDDTFELLIAQEVKPVTKDMLVTLIKYYYSALRFLILDDSSQLNQCFDSQFFTRQNITKHLADLRKKELSEQEEDCFQQIEKMLSNKTLPKKTKITQIFTQLRLMLTTEIDTIITSAARTSLEELEKSVVAGSIEECWSEWSERFKLSSTYMHKMSSQRCMGEQENVSIDHQLQILYSNFEAHLQGEENREELLVDKIQDTSCMDRLKSQSR